MDSANSYKNISLADDRDRVPAHEHDNEHDESSTEVEDSLIGDNDKQWIDRLDPEHSGSSRYLGHRSATRPGRFASFLAAWRHYRWLVDTVLLVIILGLLVLLRLEVSRRPASSFQIGGDYTGQGPQFKTKIVKWDADPKFVPTEAEAFLSNETLDNWKTLMPAGTGWGSPNETFFTTSMTHQLHCLYIMGAMYTNLALGDAIKLPLDYHSHYVHCLDYMRQSVMCAADMSLEAHEPSEADEDGKPLEGGWTGHHVCKDYGEVISYLEDQIKDGVRTVLPVDD